jgi:predicted dinucleotide-binding enzyme
MFTGGSYLRSDLGDVAHQLSSDIGMEPLNGGPLENAAIAEEFAKMLVAIVRDAGDGPLFYRFAAPRNF